MCEHSFHLWNTYPFARALSRTCSGHSKSLWCFGLMLTVDPAFVDSHASICVAHIHRLTLIALGLFLLALIGFVPLTRVLQALSFLSLSSICTFNNDQCSCELLKFHHWHGSSSLSLHCPLFSTTFSEAFLPSAVPVWWYQIHSTKTVETMHLTIVNFFCTSMLKNWSWSLDVIEMTNFLAFSRKCTIFALPFSPGLFAPPVQNDVKHESLAVKVFHMWFTFFMWFVCFFLLTFQFVAVKSSSVPGKMKMEEKPLVLSSVPKQL